MNDSAQVDPLQRDIDRRERLRIPAPRLEYRPLKERVQDFEEACLGFSPETARVEASRCIQCPSPQACVLACPLHNDIPSAMWEISKGNFQQAAAAYRRTSNFPELCGRLCPDEFLCAGSCPVGRFYPEIRLGRLEAFAADDQRQAEGFPIPELAPPTGRRVAVAGSGPAGLTVAEELARLGHKVTVLEAQRRPGGTLVYTIPRFRLPVAVVEAKIAQLEAMGVEFVLQTRVGQDVSVDDLFLQGYQAVLLGTGAGLEAVSDLRGADLEGVYLSTEFLMRTNLDEAYIPPEKQSPIEVGERVAVFGGGHAAVDSARTAVRMGAQDVTCFYRGSETDMPCRLEDRLAAQQEGVRLVGLVEPAVLIGDKAGHVTQVLCQRMRLGSRDPRQQATPVEGSMYTADADLVVLAPERGADRLIVERTPGLEVDSEGWIATDEETGQTTRRGVFAAGDNNGRLHLGVLAIAEGRKVAGSIHQYLNGLD
jgi:glutamate synthase (NADPH/NADH) small chain